VIAGQISYVGVVSGDDERLGQAGISRATVTLEPAPGSASSDVIATSKSGENGEFSLKIGKGAWPTDRVVVRVMSSGHATARGVVYLPRDGQRLLVLLERTEAD
jgi:hypothetical protein